MSYSCRFSFLCLTIALQVKFGFECVLEITEQKRWRAEEKRKKKCSFQFLFCLDFEVLVSFGAKLQSAWLCPWLACTCCLCWNKTVSQLEATKRHFVYLKLSGFFYFNFGKVLHLYFCVNPTFTFLWIMVCLLWTDPWKAKCTTHYSLK